MQNFRRSFISVLLFIVAAILIYLNCALFYQPGFRRDHNCVYNEDLLAQLRFLKTEIHNGAAMHMQESYPEGFIFMNALYGLSWCGFAQKLPYDSKLYREAQTETGWAYKQIDSETGRAPFQKSLPVPYGAFYAGWRNYLLAKKLSIEQPAFRDTNEMNAFEKQSAEIASGIVATGSPFPESYSGMAWPADASPGIASLAIHDHLLAPKYTTVITEWIEKAKHGLDENGLLPHQVNPVTNHIIQAAKGESQSLILSFLIEIDSSFAAQQFHIYKEKFLDSRFGLPGIREFPKGISGGGDVDSGPVILDIGGAASLTGQRTMALYGETTAATGLRNSIEAFGCAYTSGGEKKFLLGKWPMADVFIAWANSTENSPENALSSNEKWRWKFQLYTWPVIALCIYFSVRTWKPGLLFRRKKPANVS